ncbi:MAG: hypothetical protein ABIF82_12610 [Planctomycetota bacterium]
MEKLRKKGLDIQPVEIEGRKIARTFWGEAWCDHLESFSDYENRLPRGRTYVRNGSVCHLEIAKGAVNAMVSGSELYKVDVTVGKLPRNKWADIKGRCAGQIGSLLELLQGRLSENVMTVVTDRKNGLFPLSKEISFNCSCPDWAVMCKHVAAVLYGVGARLDEKPELLFLLRGVDQEDLISAQAGAVAAVTTGAQGGRRRIADDAISDVFGIEISEAEAPDGGTSTRRGKRAGSARRKTAAGKKLRRSKVMAKLPKKEKAKAKKETTRRKRASASGRASANKTSHAAPGEQSFTGADVAKLRAKFGMSPSQFAKALGVSTLSVSNWEKHGGTLNLQARSLGALRAAKRLTKRQAWRKLSGA